MPRIVFLFLILPSLLGAQMPIPESIPLEDFDTLFVGDLVQAEANLRALLPRAKKENHSIYLQILSQIALAQAVQKKFVQAHETLDQADKQLAKDDHLARVRLLLERGRVYFQEGKVDRAKPLFVQSYELSAHYGFDAHTINAAHMVPFVLNTAQEKIEWNQKAIKIAKTSESVKAQDWLGSLFNNLGQALLEAEQYESALDAFENALHYREEEDLTPNIRVAKWAIARTLRFLSRKEEALKICLALADEYEAMVEDDALDIPETLLFSSRGLVYEELAQLGGKNAKVYARKAHDDLSKDEWFCRLEKERLNRLEQMARNPS